MNKRPPRRFKIIYGEAESLKRLALLYSDYEPVLYSDKHHYETLGYTKRGYVIDKLVNDGPISHIRLRITAKDWNLLIRSLGLKRHENYCKAWRLE